MNPFEALTRNLRAASIAYENRQLQEKLAYEAHEQSRKDVSAAWRVLEEARRELLDFVEKASAA